MNEADLFRLCFHQLLSEVVCTLASGEFYGLTIALVFCLFSLGRTCLKVWMCYFYQLSWKLYPF
jgi:hypothetical protein